MVNHHPTSMIIILLPETTRVDSIMLILKNKYRSKMHSRNTGNSYVFKCRTIGRERHGRGQKRRRKI